MKPTSGSSSREIDQVQYICKMKFFPALKNDMISCVGKWVQLEAI